MGCLNGSTIFKETFTKRKFLAICVGFSGILIIARPEASGLSIGMLAAIFCAVGFAGSVLTTKLLTRKYSVTCILFWLTVMQFLLSLFLRVYMEILPFQKSHPYTGLL